MINVGIVGATGYTGEELIEILLGHSGVRLKNISSRADKPRLVCDIFPKFAGRTNLFCVKTDVSEIAKSCDVVFLALPHTASMGIAPQILKHGIKVIDLSADYRLKDVNIYKKFYNLKHKDKSYLSKSVYGLPELQRAKIKSASLIANPGCYPTVCILGLAPLVALGLIETDSIIIDAKSGVTGAGKKLEDGFMFAEVNEDFKAYKVNTHQHAPEIDQELSKLSGRKLNVTFVPHLLPLSRGILATLYVKKTKNLKSKTQNLVELYKKFYKTEPFVRVRKAGEFPRLKDVVKTNFCDIGIKEEQNSVIIVAAIDNLLKGTSGQAVHNMNIMYGFPETEGLF
jgi:N-acetyl-gamma-glutamyl-phosphate reductase